MNDKPRLVEITVGEAFKINAGRVDDLAAPFVYHRSDNRYYVDADELRAWRLLQSQASQSYDFTSGEQP